MRKECTNCGKKGCYNKCIRRKAYYEENKEKEITRVKEWRKENKEKVIVYKKERYESNKNDHMAKVRARRQNMTLRTLPGDETALRRIYEDRDLINSVLPHRKATVDHIIPLKHELVSGLHVSWNLQIIPQPDNDAKNNKWDGTYDNRGWNNEGIR